ncbi:MAG: TIGR03087 family PEP-CTERM/XrtA system glycosyltransferase [Sphingomonadales bacterium]|nr:MAG: TIGR03087 family PEP-CTERM/XrtA system glycosyltransferase [Sphingomonadales bacterium]
MMHVLFLAHRIPFPPDKGDKIRSFNMLCHISSRARVHLGCFVDDPDDFAHADALMMRCESLRMLPLERNRALLRGLPAILGGQSITQAMYHDPQMQEWVNETIRHYPIEAIFLYSSAMAPYAADHGTGRRVVMDFVDMDSDKWRQYAAAKRWPMSLVYKREAEKLFDLERTVAARVDHSLFVSEAEALTFRREAGSAAHDTRGLSNGVDHAYFAPGLVAPAALPGAPRLVFTGAMDYWANVDAVTWFVDAVFPKVRAAMPEASFTIVGSKPTPAVQALGSKPGVHVTGRVPDVRPYLEAADIAVAPLRIARGIQNKVLEAMAMARPVVCTPEAFEGIEATNGAALQVAESADQTADAILALMQDPVRRQAMGAAARAVILERYDWDTALAALDPMLGLPETETTEIDACPEEAHS